MLLSPARRAQIPPFHVMDVWAAAGERQRTHGDLVNLSAGQPSTPAPGAGARGRGEGAGRPRCSATPSRWASRRCAPRSPRTTAATYGLDVAPEDVVVTTGCSGGFLLAFLAAFDAGDRVAMARPGYPCYRNILTALGCEVVELPCGPETRYQPTVAMLEALDEPVEGLVVASPANPTGTVLDPAELAALAHWCADNGVQLVSDEIYHGIAYPGAPEPSCAWATSREAIVVNSFSKYFSMTGWRLGWLLLPPRLLRAADCLAGNFTVCPPALPQVAALAAFDAESYAEADGHVARYQVNRDLLLDGLTRLGITRLAPADGAFYVYADVAHLTARLDGPRVPAAGRRRARRRPGPGLRPGRGPPVHPALLRGLGRRGAGGARAVGALAGVLRCPACSPTRLTSRA